MTRSTTTSSLALVPSLETAWQDVDSSFERFCLTAAIGARPLRDPLLSLSEIGAVAANVLARAIARGVYEARALPFAGAKPAWKDKFGR